MEITRFAKQIIIAYIEIYNVFITKKKYVLIHQ